MPRSIRVAIDDAGHVLPLNEAEDSPRIPAGRAILTWPAPDEDATLLLSEKSLAEDWLRPEEDEAWAHLQQDM